jgi:hypothetical protein
MPINVMGPGVGVPGGAGAGGVGPGGVGAAAKASAAGAEKVNIEDITDVMGYSGVDLKEESDNIIRDNDGYSRSNTTSDGQDRTRVQNFINQRILKASVERVGMYPRRTNWLDSGFSCISQDDPLVLTPPSLFLHKPVNSCKTQDSGH